MNRQDSHSTVSGLAIPVTLILLGVGTLSPATQAAEGISQPGTESHHLLAATDGMERRQDRREDRRDGRGDRRDVRQDCREEEGIAGKDKRDCKQEGRKDRRDDTSD